MPAAQARALYEEYLQNDTVRRKTNGQTICHITVNKGGIMVAEPLSSMLVTRNV
jgi:hypothetical protein